MHIVVAPFLSALLLPDDLHIVSAYVVMADIVSAYIFMAHIASVYIVRAHIVSGLHSYGLRSYVP